MPKTFQSTSPALPQPKAKVGPVPLTPEGLQVEAGVSKASAANITKAKEEGLAIVGEFQGLVPVVETEDDYLEADSSLTRILQARKRWKLRMYGEKNDGIIPNIRKGLDQLYALFAEVDKPLEQTEGAFKRAMAAFKDRERRLIEETRRVQEAEAARLRQQAEDLRAKEEAAKTRQMRERLAEARRVTEAQAEAAEEVEAPLPVQGRTGTRTIKAWRIIDMVAFIQGAASGTIPGWAVAAATVEINKAFRNDPDSLKLWPGVEVYDETQIVGR